MIRVVVVTDRKLIAPDKLAARVEAMLAAAPRGSVLIQIREKDLDGGPLLRIVQDVLEVARPAGAPVWVNDRVDVALVARADGVHLPEHGMSIEDARAAASAIGRSLGIGASRHSANNVVAAANQGAELVQFGPIWPTPGKGPELGLDALKIKMSARLVAVGGIDGPARARHAAVAGADAVAVIRAAWSGDADAIGKLVEAVDAGLRSRS